MVDQAEDDGKDDEVVQSLKAQTPVDHGGPSSLND